MCIWVGMAETVAMENIWSYSLPRKVSHWWNFQRASKKHGLKGTSRLGGGRGGFPGSSVVKNPPDNAGSTGDAGSIPEWGRSPGGGNGSSLWYSCLENPMDREAWQATVHGIAKHWIQLNYWAHTHQAGWSEFNPPNLGSTSHCLTP